MTIAFRVTHVQIRAFAKRHPADGLGFNLSQFALEVNLYPSAQLDSVALRQCRQRSLQGFGVGHPGRLKCSRLGLQTGQFSVHKLEAGGCQRSGDLQRLENR